MKKEVTIKITVTDDNIALDCDNLLELTKNDIIESIEVLVSLGKIMNIIW